MPGPDRYGARHAEFIVRRIGAARRPCPSPDFENLTWRKRRSIELNWTTTMVFGGGPPFRGGGGSATNKMADVFA